MCVAYAVVSCVSAQSAFLQVHMFPLFTVTLTKHDVYDAAAAVHERVCACWFPVTLLSLQTNERTLCSDLLSGLLSPLSVSFSCFSTTTFYSI